MPKKLITEIQQTCVGFTFKWDPIGGTSVNDMDNIHDIGGHADIFWEFFEMDEHKTATIPSITEKEGKEWVEQILKDTKEYFYELCSNITNKDYKREWYRDRKWAKDGEYERAIKEELKEVMLYEQMEIEIKKKDYNQFWKLYFNHHNSHGEWAGMVCRAIYNTNDWKAWKTISPEFSDQGWDS